jgi:regulator of protease activity HflC (stomatin/prohibitin superfamily)
MHSKVSGLVQGLIVLLFFVGMIGYSLYEANVISVPALFFVILGLFLIIFLIGGLRVVNQYERGVVLTLGKYTSTR